MPGSSFKARRTYPADEATTDMLPGFLGVWREEKRRRRFLAWQSGKLPEPAHGAK